MSESLHNILVRQLKRHRGSAENLPPEWASFLRAVNDAYREFDKDRGMLERSLELSSEELIQANTSLRESETRYRTFIDATSDLVFLKDDAFRYLFINRAYLAFLDKSAADIIGHTDFDLMPPDMARHCRASDQQARDRNASVATEEVVGAQTFQTIKFPVPLPGERIGIGGYIRDLTHQRRAETEHARLQAQVNQLQKIESVGRLAGGVAHDFNNMLQVILGHVELAFDHLENAPRLQQDLEEIRKAAGHSADLTRQLLAFARKQTVMPQVLDLNKTIAGMLQMMQRMIGEDITLVWNPAAALWSVKMDPSQIDQILANLCTNARDAMPNGGTLAIETANAALDAAACAALPESTPGDYVRISVRDSGCGMDRETLSHLFEPFFTTKVFGQGTGLGLATVYGAIKQNRGSIRVESTPGHGTVFHIYLPSYAAPAPLHRPVSIAAPPIVHGSETMVLVEDDPIILDTTRAMLDKLGYQVLTATRPDEALRHVTQHHGKIALLMTDVVMPSMNGRELARQSLTRRPDLRVLYMSGYTANVIAHHGVLEPGIHFIPKPFTLAELSVKLREALAPATD